ncbi:MAG TPA: YajQ family cyclic di-GMP-binding protein [Bacteroidetes bacterium]|nr:YajQ family cyclic di-GMP-binding protein [Bacteroidota bacterium]
MPSFDIVSRVDMQEVDNAVNNTRKTIATRYDFRGSETSIELNRKDGVITITTEDDMKLKAVQEMLAVNFSKRKIDVKALKFGKPEATSKGHVRMTVNIKEGIEKDEAKKIVKMIKDMRLKVQPAIQDNQVRVTGKKIDDLQAVIAMLRQAELDTPLQFINMK